MIYCPKVPKDIENKLDIVNDSLSSSTKLKKKSNNIDFSHQNRFHLD